jgi:hypothetical protein
MEAQSMKERNVSGVTAWVHGHQKAVREREDRAIMEAVLRDMTVGEQ